MSLRIPTNSRKHLTRVKTEVHSDELLERTKLVQSQGCTTEEGVFANRDGLQKGKLYV